MKYKVLSYWTDNNDLYVNYEVSENNKKANVINIFEISGINKDFNSLQMEEKENIIYRLIEQDSGFEFNLPKVSELSLLLQYLYDVTCESENNMYHIDYDDWDDLVSEIGFSDREMLYLKKEIKKYNIEDYITVDDDEYMICCYGGLQSCFNDDRAFKWGYEHER